MSEALKVLIERIERLEDEKAEVAAQIRDVYAEAKGNGYDARTMRQIVRERKLTPQERAQRDALLDAYRADLGMLADTPLGQAAVDQERKRLAQQDWRQSGGGRRTAIGVVQP